MFIDTLSDSKAEIFFKLSRLNLKAPSFLLKGKRLIKLLFSISTF